jgi:hypothetical protein
MEMCHEKDRSKQSRLAILRSKHKSLKLDMMQARQVRFAVRFLGGGSPERYYGTN